MTTAIILAGGFGTRLRSVVPDLPKPMAPVNGHPFLSFLMDYWIAQGVEKFILSVGYKSEIIQDFYDNEYHKTPVEYSVEDTPLGTGGGLILAMQKLTTEKEVLVLNGDTFFSVDLPSLKWCSESSNADIVIALFKTKSRGRYGSVNIDAEGRIISFTDEDATSKSYCNGGVYLIQRNIFSKFVKTIRSDSFISLEKEIFFNLLVNKANLRGFFTQGIFIDIGVPDDYKRVSEKSFNFI